MHQVWFSTANIPRMFENVQSVRLFQSPFMKEVALQEIRVRLSFAAVRVDEEFCICERMWRRWGDLRLALEDRGGERWETLTFLTTLSLK
jgi:hypothetical protein